MTRTKQTARPSHPHALAGGGHHHGGHHGGHRGGGRGPRFIGPEWGWSAPAYLQPDPCVTPWLFPRGACTAWLEAQKDGLKGGLGACCDGCATGKGCSGGGLGDFDGTKLTTAVVIGAIGLLAYHAFFK
jgi:hypothetical protein